MNFINKIWINAIYEIKIFLRSWFFRIFSGLSFAILLFINFIFFSDVGKVPRIFNGISSFAPYANFAILNIVQCTVLIFLATDIIKRDHKINTNQVFYIRSMSNAEYLIGKALGLFVVFAGLNVIIMIMSAIFQLTFTDINFSWQPYFIYPSLMSFPAIIFILGLSFLFMHLFKNQALVIILLLGYFSAELFYLDTQLFYLFDFLPVNLPLLFSDFVGISHLNLILLQRGLYLILGGTFIFASIIMFKRLPQSLWMKRFSVSVVIAGILASIIMGYLYTSFYTKRLDFRTEIREINKKYLQIPTVHILKCELNLSHLGDMIDVKATIHFVNSSDQSLDKYFFSINPGLSVKNLEGNNSIYQYDRTDHILNVKPQHPLNPGQIDSVQIYYSGEIDERYCYLDIPDEELTERFRIWMYQIDKKYAFIHQNFLLLTPECNWYPVAGLPYGIGFPQRNQKDFVHFKLIVNTDKNLTAISQGAVENPDKGKFIFTPENPLSDLSLIIAPYKERTVNIDGLKYSLYTLPEHRYFENYFTQIGDTLNSLIRESRQEFENKLGLNYPFHRFNVIEVPIQFFAYPRIWTLASSRVLPEMALIPEGGVYLAGADFKFLEMQQNRRNTSGQMTLTDQEKQAFLFKRFLDFTLLGDNPQFRFIGDLMQPQQPNHNIFPNFYTYLVHFYSDSLALFNLALESYFYDKVGVSGEVSSWFNERLTSGEQVSRSLNGTSLQALMEDSADVEMLPEILRLKGAHLIKLLQSNVDREKLNTFFYKAIIEHQFTSSDMSFLSDALKEQYELDIFPYFNNWYSSTTLPGFIIKDTDLFKVLDRDRIRYQVLFKIANPEGITGLTEVRFRFSGRRWFEERSGVEEPTRVIKLEPGIAKLVGIVLDEEPRIIYMNPGIGLNIPLAYAHRFDETELKENFTPFDGEKILTENLDHIPDNEIIVDNEDNSFKTKGENEQSFLQKIIHGDNKKESKEFGRFRFWRPPDQWELIKSTGFFGKYIHSAMYIQAGQGDRYAQWKAQLPESGNYSVYTYTINKFSFGRKEIFERNLGEFHYIVYHDDGSNEIIIDCLKVDEGWNLLGSYYFSGGEAKVELTDKTNGRLVIADAVKWVRD